MEKMNQTLAEIKPLDQKAMAGVRKRQDNLTKPQGSLGQLESLSVQIAGIKGNPRPRVAQKVIFTLAADHGVTKEGVSAYPSEVTPQMVYNSSRRRCDQRSRPAHRSSGGCRRSRSGVRP